MEDGRERECYPSHIVERLWLHLAYTIARKRTPVFKENGMIILVI
jgi:hypothetical protein